jgi:tRNA/rRNA methyltransferase
MANFGFQRLILVEPAAPLGSTARAMAMHAHHILEGAERYPTFEEALAEFEVVIGTASLRERGWPDPVLTARELPAWFDQHATGARAAVVFGPEVSGLTSRELARMTALVSIPCAPEQPTLNLAQAAVLVAYELSIGQAPNWVRSHVEPARRAPFRLLERVDRELVELLHLAGFARDRTFRRVRDDIRRVLARAELSEREAMILGGIVRRTRRTLERLRGTATPRPSDSLTAE